MAAPGGAGQYEDAFRPHRLQNWSVPRPGRQHPSLREGSTPIVADDRGHLLPAVPRSQASPWGSFVGTWEMPPRIPPARLDLTSRSPAAAARLVGWIQRPTALTRACNGLRTEITGKPQEPRSDTQKAKDTSRGSSGAPSESVQPAGASPGAPLEELPGPVAGATAAAPGSGEPGCSGLQPKAGTSLEPPPACQPCSQQAQHGGQTPRSRQPAVTEFRRGDTNLPEIPASTRPPPRGASPRRATPPQGSDPGPGGSTEAKPQGGSSPGLRVSPCARGGEASPKGSPAGVSEGHPSRTGL